MRQRDNSSISFPGVIFSILITLTCCTPANFDEGTPPKKGHIRFSPLKFTYNEDQASCSIKCINSSIQDITIPESYQNHSVTTIEKDAFCNCRKLRSVTIPKWITRIQENPFFGCSALTEIFVDEENPNYCSIDGNLYTKDKSVLLVYAPGKTESAFSIPASVTRVGKNAFRNCSQLTRITLPDSVESIEQGAFCDCSEIRDLILPGALKIIKKGAFMRCGNLTSITIPDSVESIEQEAFWKCLNLSNIIIPQSVTHIGARAFILNCRTIVYCGADKQPATWHSPFHLLPFTNQEIIWGYTGANTISFYFKAPSWVNSPVLLTTNGNGTKWEEKNMRIMSWEGRWYKKTIKVDDRNLPITYQIKIQKWGEPKKCMKKNNDFHQLPEIIAKNGYVVIDGSDNATYQWEKNDFYLQGPGLIHTPEISPEPQILKKARQ